MMFGSVVIVAATLTRFLDPYTVVYQSDESKADM